MWTYLKGSGSNTAAVLAAALALAVFLAALAAALSCFPRYSPCWLATCAVAGWLESMASAWARAVANSCSDSAPLLSWSNLSTMPCSLLSPCPLLRPPVSAWSCGYVVCSRAMMVDSSAASTDPLPSVSACLNSSLAWSSSSAPAAALDLMSAQSPSAYTLPSCTPLTRRHLSTASARRAGCPNAACKLLTKGYVPSPVDHTQTPK
mmetsp:Transcript_2233/g.4999  ORF Transcript_2233/g.4999 Transcript_2233/m.4999 type:complete len:206 (-) Transcript_2233:998-1615(-)